MASVCPRCQSSGYAVQLEPDLSCAACGTRWQRGPLNQFISLGSRSTDS